MLTASIIGVLACLLASVMSKSAFRWACFMAASLASGYALGSVGAHSFLVVSYAVVTMMMLGYRQQLNDEWQNIIVVLQMVVVGLYATLTVFGGDAPWLNFYLVRAGNMIFLLELVVLFCGGLNNSIRNFFYIRDQRRRGNRLPWFRSAWQMI